MKKLIVLLILVGIFTFGYARAAQDLTAASKVNYDGQSPVDGDLDGLTDQAEIQIYHTDPRNPDTDGDGYYDGSEVLSLSDPLDVDSIPGMPAVSQDVTTSSTGETPWAWYVARTGGLIGFVLLYLSIFLGLTIRVSFLRKLFSPLYAMQAHGWIAFQATAFAFIHGMVLIFDKFMGFKIIDVLVPFASSYKPTLVALGIIGFYLMVILTASSYARKYMSQKIWRGLHFLNIFLYGFVIAHAYLLGTDMKNELIRNIFIYANIFLILLMFINMFSRIKQNIERRNIANQAPAQPTIQ
jgi:hypothetical protein